MEQKTDRLYPSENIHLEQIRRKKNDASSFKSSITNPKEMNTVFNDKN